MDLITKEENIAKENREMIQALKDKSDDDFEKNLVLITSGTLVLSMTFIEKIVPLPGATWIWLLICSWAFLVISLLLNLISHRLASRNSLNYIYEQAKDTPLDEINKIIKADNDVMKKINDWTVALMISGIVFIVVYCSINVCIMSKSKIPVAKEKPVSGRIEGVVKAGRQSALLVVPTVTTKPIAATNTNDKKKP